MLDPIEAIRAALAADATPETRSAGAAVCRSILAVLEPGVAPQPAPLISPESVQQLVGMLGKMDVDQVLDVAIGRLRAMTAANGQPSIEEPARRMAIRMVQIPHVPEVGA